MDYEEQQKFEKDIAAAAAHLEEASSARDVAAVMERISARTEAAVDAALTSEAAEMIACRAGCSVCCSLNVSVLLPEAVAIAQYLTANLPPAMLPRMKAVLGETAERVRWIEDDERRRLRISCPFLDTRGWCSIHLARPLVCRSITSTDPDICRQAMDADPCEPVPVVMNLVQKYLFDTSFRTLGDTLDRLGLESRSYELSRAVWHCLVDPELATRFLAGCQVSLS
ncbi:MAG: YkgJ family cysteine cluster protein [Geobacter sp.]|nr:YkgJ family cysteine cluster protein [Geobacter sp.]